MASQRKPVLVFLKSDTVPNSLALASFLSKQGQLEYCRVVVIDANQITEDLKEGLQCNEAPVLLLLFKQQIVHDLRGALSDRELN